MPPPIAFLITAAAMWLAARWTPVLDVPPLARYATAALPAVAALIAPLAIWRFREAETTVDPVHVDRMTSLVTSGPFAYTRNPMYLGLALLLLAWAVILSAPWALLGPILFVLYITRFQIMPEERAMAAKFGPAYEDYKRRVKRWI